MTREHKLALVVGFGLILFVGILLSDHLRREPGIATSLPTATSSTLWSMPETLAQRTDTRLADPQRGIGTPSLPPASLPDTPATMPAVLTFSPGNASLGQLGSPNEGAIDPAPLPQAASAEIHVITPGDTLQSISLVHFGTTKRWPEIASLNNITNADRIREGQKLRLPSGEPSRPLPKSSSQPATRTPTSTTYTVAKGDTLSAIAQKMLGSAKRWREIKSLNGINDPAEIRIGNVLNLPTT